MNWHGAPTAGAWWLGGSRVGGFGAHVRPGYSLLLLLLLQVHAASAAVDLFEVVALVTVALFLLVGVVVAALRPAPLLGLLLGRLRPPASLAALATRVAFRAEVGAAWRHIAAATPPALSLVLVLVLGLGLLRGSGLDCSLALLWAEGEKKEKWV